MGDWSCWDSELEADPRHLDDGYHHHRRSKEVRGSMADVDVSPFLSLSGVPVSLTHVVSGGPSLPPIPPGVSAVLAPGKLPCLYYSGPDVPNRSFESISAILDLTMPPIHSRLMTPLKQNCLIDSPSTIYIGFPINLLLLKDQ